MPSFPVPVLSFLFVPFRPSLLRSHSCSTGACLLLSLSAFPLPIRFLSSASLPVLTTQSAVLPFLLFPVPPYSCFPGARLRSRFLGSPLLSSLISHAFRPVLSTRLSVRFRSPFPDSLPTAVPQVLTLCSRFRYFPLPLRFLSSALVPPPATWPSVSSVPFFLDSPLSGFSSASVLPFGFPVFHLLFCLVSHASFPVFGTWLSVRFLSSYPVSLPQPFHRCFPRAFAFGLFCLLSAFFRPLQPASDYSAFCSVFSLLPVLPWQRFLRCMLSSSVGPVSMPSFRFRYSAFCNSFLRPPSCLTVATPASQPSDFSSGLVPLAFALGSGYLACLF